eukprot:FR736166.1.p1 GENE.FR736166.1~~FR736166.1.p1  ORF type:complete len:198 (+),score=13.88 FR736166.1:3-596(+)
MLRVTVFGNVVGTQSVLLAVSVLAVNAVVCLLSNTQSVERRAMLFLALAFGTAVAWQNTASTVRGITVGVVAMLNLARTGYGLFHCLARPLRFLEVMTNGVGIIAAMLVYTHATHTAESKLRPIDGAAIGVIIFGLYMTMSAESHMGNADAPLVGAQLRLLSALHVHLGWAALTQNRWTVVVPVVMAFGFVSGIYIP